MAHTCRAALQKKLCYAFAFLCYGAVSACSWFDIAAAEFGEVWLESRVVLAVFEVITKSFSCALQFGWSVRLTMTMGLGRPCWQRNMENREKKIKTHVR